VSAKVITIPSKLWDWAVKAGILFLICLIIGSMINLFSPSATLALDEDDRLLFWIILCLIGGAGTFICDVALDILTVKWGLAIQAFAKATCGAVAVLIPVFMIYEPAELPNTSTTIILVWAIMALIVAGALIITQNLNSHRIEVKADEDKKTEDGPVQILSRLPVHAQNADLYALSAEDHYVRVHTSKGAEIVLMRLSDAIAETGNLPGMQTHRSWWVCKSAVSAIIPKGRTAEITLSNDLKVPVSRNALKVLKTNGWL